MIYYFPRDDISLFASVAEIGKHAFYEYSSSCSAANSTFTGNNGFSQQNTIKCGRTYLITLDAPFPFYTNFRSDEVNGSCNGQCNN